MPVMPTRSYEEHYDNGVIAIITLSDGEIRYSVVKDATIFYNSAITGRYSRRLAARYSSEQDEVAIRLSR